MTHIIPAAAVVATWERAYALGPVEKALMMCSLARPGESLARLSGWSIGKRDFALLGLRVALFGAEVQSIDACADCGTQMEINFAIPDVMTPAAAGQDRARTLEVDGRRLAVRAVCSADLLSVAGITAGKRRRTALLERCLTPVAAESSATEPGANVAEWSDAQQTVLAQTLADIDPQADVRVAVACDGCGKLWSCRFDIGRFLWREIDVWARQLLAEVYALASAFGWSESSILAMASWRRQVYLGMLRR